MNRKRRLPPQTLLYTGKYPQPTQLTHIQYNQKSVQKFSGLQPLVDDQVDWIIVEGLTDIDYIRQLCQDFGVDPMVIEDVFNVQQRNKIEVASEYIFSVHKYAIDMNDNRQTDYISMLLFEDKLLTFSEKNNLFVDDVLKRLENPDSMLRKHGIKYLFYVLHDMMVDESLNLLSELEKQIEHLETRLLSIGRQDEVFLYKLRRDLLFLRNLSNQFLDNIYKDETIKRLSSPSIKKFYDDLKDHLINLREKTRFDIDVVHHFYDMHLNNISHKTNAIMKTLTIFSAIFIPLSFIAGIFGMNFVRFPILMNDYGLIYFGLICFLVITLMLLYFFKKKWF